MFLGLSLVFGLIGPLRWTNSTPHVPLKLSILSTLSSSQLAFLVYPWSASFDPLQPFSLLFNWQPFNPVGPEAFPRLYHGDFGQPGCGTWQWHSTRLDLTRLDLWRVGAHGDSMSNRMNGLSSMFLLQTDPVRAPLVQLDPSTQP